MNTVTVKFGFYGKKAFDVFNMAFYIMQMNNPHFFDKISIPRVFSKNSCKLYMDCDNEVVIDVSGYFDVTKDEVLLSLAKVLKEIVKYLNQAWNRLNKNIITVKCQNRNPISSKLISDFNYDVNVRVSQLYYIYDVLKGRNADGKSAYNAEEVKEIRGERLDALTAEMVKSLREEIEIIDAEAKNEVIQLEAKRRDELMNVKQKYSDLLNEKNEEYDNKRKDIMLKLKNLTGIEQVNNEELNKLIMNTILNSKTICLK